MARTLVLLTVPAVLLAACSSTSGAPAPAANTAAPAAAPAGLNLPCQPGSGKQVTSSGPMNLTDMAGQQLACAVFDHLTMNQVSLKDAQLPGAAFRSSTLNKVNFSKASLLGAVFEASTLNFPDFTGADLRAANLSGAQLNNPVWTDATCPDGTKAAPDCTAHLTPLSTVDAPVSAPASTTTTEVAAPAPAPTTTEAPPAAPKAPAIFNAAAHGTYTCPSGTLSINGANSDLHLIGQCDTVIVNGASSKVEIDTATRIIVNGAKATVTYHNNAQVLVNGAGATAHRA
jgi:Protein of unknown function (DUF3060)/Pentapeptide repeats (9 copies)